MYSFYPGSFPHSYLQAQGMQIMPFRYSYPGTGAVSKAQADLNKHLRLLWMQHVVWTRLTIISMIFGLPDVNMVTDRLLRNPKLFEASLRPLYGDRAASRFADLLTNHLVIAAELAKAAKAGDSTAAEAAENMWYANADEIAAFLGGINPYWSEQQWKDMLYEHLDLTKSEAVSILTGNYEEGIGVFDQIAEQALQMADVMTQGIIRQFPNHFV